MGAHVSTTRSESFGVSKPLRKEAPKCSLSLPSRFLRKVRRTSVNAWLLSYMTLKGPFFNLEVGTGIKSITLFEFDQTKTGEAMEYVADRYAKYIGVPGLTYSIALWFEAKEGLKMIGLA